MVTEDAATQLERAGRVEELIRLYENRAEEVGRPDEAASLLSRAAELARTKLKDLARAESLYSRALAHSASAKEALEGIRNLYEQRNDFAALAQTLERLAAIHTGAQASELYLKAANLLETKLARRDRAILCCQLATRAAPQDRLAFQTARRLLLAEGHVQSAFESLERERKNLGDSEMLEPYLELAGRLSDDPYEHVLLGVVLERCMSLDPKNSKVAQIRDENQRLPETWKELVRDLKAKSLEERDRRTAARLSLRVARLVSFFEPSATPKVKEAIDRCFVLWPAMPEALNLLERVAEKAGDLRVAVAVFQRLISDTQDKTAVVDLWLRIGILQHSRLGDLPAAAESFEKATQLDPSRSDAAAPAAELLIALGKNTAGLNVLERHLEHLKVKRARVALHEQLADLWARLEEDSARAKAHLSAAIALEPHDSSVAFRLVKLLARERALDELWPHLAVARLAPRSVAEKARLFEAIAALFEGAQQFERAFMTYCWALLLQPKQGDLVAAAERAAEQAGKMNEWASVLERCAAQTEGPVAIGLFRHLAELYAGKLNNPVQALEAYREVVKRDPHDAAAAQTITQLEASMGSAPQDARQSLEAEALRLESTAADPRATLEIYQKILELDPDDLPTLKKLGGVCAALGQWDQVAVTAERLMALAESAADRAQWRSRLAQLYAERLNREDEAAVLFLQLLAEGFRDATVLQGLERLAASKVRQVEIARALAPHYARSQDHQRQVASLLVLLSSAQEPAEQKGLLELLAQASEHHLLDERAAYEYRVRGLTLDPSDSTFQAEAVRLAKAQKVHAEHARLLTDLAAKTSDAALAHRLGLDAAHIASEGGAVEEGIHALKGMLQKSPDDLEVLERLSALFLKTGRLLDADGIIRRRLLLADEGAKKALYLELADVSDGLHRPREAAVATAEAIKHGAPEEELLPKLATYLEGAGRAEELERVLARQMTLAQKAGDEERARALSLKRARLQEGSLNDKTGAVQQYAEALKSKPSDPDAIAALENLMGDPVARESAARALLPAYDAANDHRKKVTALSAIAEASKDALEKLETYQQIAKIQSYHLRQPEQAFAALASALRLAPDDAALRAQALASAEAADLVDAYADVLEEVVGSLNESVGVTVRYELAQVYEKKLNDLPRAIDQLSQVLAVDAKHVDALRAVVRLHRARENWSELVKVSQQLSSVLSSAEQKTELDREIALVSEQKLGDLELAATHWRSISTRDAAAKDAAQALDRIYTQLDRPKELVFALELRRNQEGPGAKAHEFVFRLAQLKVRLEDSAAALEMYRQILAEDPTHQGAWDALNGWVRSDSPHHAAALEILDAVLIRSADHSGRIALREGRLENAPAGDRQKLSAEIRAIFERDLKQPQAAFMRALKAFADGEDRAHIRPELERLAEVTEAFEELAEIYEDVAQSADADEKAVLLRRSAELRQQLQQPDEAAKNWKALLELVPNDAAALDALSRLFESSKNAKSLAEVLLKKAQVAAEPSERFSLLLKSGEALESSGDDAGAIEAFAAAIQIEPSVPAFQALERLFGKEKRLEEQAQVLGQLYEFVPDEAERAELSLKQAHLWEKVSYPSEALAAYERVLNLFPSNDEAIRGLEGLLKVDEVRAAVARCLEPHLIRNKDAKRLVEVLQIKAETIEEGERARVWNEVATLREGLSQKPMAFAARLKAFTYAPSDVDAHRQLERLAAELGNFEELAAAYEDQLERGVDPPVALELWRRLAMIYTERLERLDFAARAWNQVLAREPKNLSVLDALARIFRKTADYKNLSLVMRRQLALSPTVDAQVNLLFELANLAEETLSDKSLAAQCYQEILNRKPEDPNASQFLMRVLAQTERYQDLAEVVARQIQLSEKQGQIEQALELRVRLGRLKLQRLNDGAGALEQFREVLKRKAAHAGAVGALEEMAKSESTLKGEAARELEPVFAQEGDHLKLVQMLESRVTQEPDVRERVALLKKIAEAYQTQMDNAEMAFVTAARALRELPDDEGTLSICMNLYQRADAADEMVSLLTECAPKASEDARRAQLFRVLAQIHGQQEQVEESIQAWKRVLELLPTDTEALDALGRLLAQGGRIQELIDVLKRQLAMADDPQLRTGLLFQMGSMQQDYLKDLGGATATFRRLLELAPEEPRALERMDRLCEEQERWPELADVLVRRMKVATEDTLYSVKYRLGVVRETKLLDKAGAVELYKELLAADPRNSGALSRLEALVTKEPQNLEAVDALAKAFRATSDFVRLAQVIEARVAVSPDPDERKIRFLELSAVRDAQGEPELAFLSLWKAFKEDPNDASLRQRLDVAAEVAKSYEELVTAFEEALPRIAESQDAAEVCLRLGQILETKVREPEQAITFYERAREIKPEVGQRALPALDRLYGNSGQHERQAEILEMLAATTAEPAERVALLFRLGQLAMGKLESPDQAVAAFEKILEVDRTHLPALRSLEQLHETAQAHDKLYRVLEMQREVAQGPERERLLQRIATVAADGLGNVEESISVYRELLQKNPRNEQAFSQLEKLLDKAGQHEALFELLKGKLAVTVDPRELVRLNERVGTALYRSLQKPEEAIPYFKAALERDARNKSSLQALRDIFEQLDKKDELVMVLRRLIPLQEDVREVKNLRIRLSEVLASHNRREEALDAARRALEVEPHEAPELKRVIAIFTGLKAYADAVRALELECQVYVALEDRDAAVKAMFEAVELWRGPANKPESAGSALEKILEIDPANRVAYEQALELYKTLNDWRSYTTAMDRYLVNLVTDEEKVASLKQLASVQEQKLGQKDVAFLKLLRAVELAPADHELRERVERLAEETEGYEELATAYEHVADNVPRGPLAERMYLVLAKVQSEKLSDLTSAEASLRKILEFDPTNEMALDALAQMFGGRGRDKEYVVALEQKLEAVGSIERRKELLREISRVFKEKLNNPREAVAALERGLALEPDVETLQSLVAIQREQSDFEAVAHSLLRMRDLAPTAEERARIQVEVAQVYERDLKNDEAAIEGYRTALEFDPGHLVALNSLEQLYTRLNRPAELLAVYERQIDVTDDYREKVKALFKSAAIWEDTYRNLPNADQCVEGVLTLDPQNIQAIKTLERLRKEQGRWEELIGVLDRHIQLVTVPAERAELCVEIGDIFHQQLKQVDRAVVAYHQALELDSRCRAAMHALGMLYERSGNWPFALDMLEKEAITAGVSKDAVELYYRMGKINEDMLIDTGSAKRCYLEALKLDASYVPCLRALKGIYAAESDWPAYEQTIIQEAQQTEDPVEKSRAMIEVAQFYLEKREDRDSATRYFEDALRLQPGEAAAAKPLADAYVAREEWPLAEKMLDIVIAAMSEQLPQDADGTVAKELCRQSYRLGYVCEKLGNKDKALQCYERAWQLDATYLPALEGLGNLLVQAQRFDEALKVYQTILIHHRDDLTDLEVVEIYWTLGDVHMRLAQRDRAQNHFEKALSIDPGHEPSLRSMVLIADELGAHEKSIEYRQKLLKGLEGDAQFAVAVELGKLAKDKVGDAHVAIEAYLLATKIRPDALDELDALYVLYRHTRQGPKAAETLEKMMAVPALKSDAGRLKRVYFAFGELNRDELNDGDKAEAAFNAALDTDWHFIEAFSALEQLLGRQKKWQALEQNYHRMIKRLPKTPETHVARMALFRALGELYHQKLKRPDAAIEVFKVVAMGLPEDVQMQEMFAELAGQQAGNEDSAIDAWRRALPQTANPGRAVGALAELFARKKDYDSAWLAAQVSSGLIGEMGANEKEILAKLNPYAKKKEVGQRALTDRLWQSHLFHPRVRGPMSEMMAILYEYVRNLYKEDFAKYQIDKKRHFIDANAAQEYQLHHFRYVSRVLGMEGVAIYSPFLTVTRERMLKKTTEPAPEPMVGVEICHTEPACLKVGGRFFSEPGQKEVYYMLGRALALLRPELALSQRLSAERLEAVFQAALSLSVERFRFTADPRAIEVERKSLEKVLPEPARAALARVSQEYVKRATPADLKNYLEGAELTAVRAGLFVAGEVEPAKKMVMGETGASFRLQPRSKIRDLMVFALGEDLHALRVAVGTHVEVVRKQS